MRQPAKPKIPWPHSIISDDTVAPMAVEALSAALLILLGNLPRLRTVAALRQLRLGGEPGAGAGGGACRLRLYSTIWVSVTWDDGAELYLYRCR